MVGLLHAMAFMVILLIGWVIWNNKPLPLPKALTWGLGFWPSLVNGFHTTNAPLLICSPATILRKQCNKQTCLTYNTNSELPARSEDKASLIRINTKTAEKLYNTTLSQNSTQTMVQTLKWDCWGVSRSVTHKHELWIWFTLFFAMTKALHLTCYSVTR